MVNNGQPATLPTEIWLQIIDHLILPSLLYLSLTSRTLYSICERKLQTHSALRTEYRHYDIRELLNSDTHPYHTLLLKILRGDLPPSYIVGLDSDEACKTDYDDDEYPDMHGGDELEPYPLQEVDKELIRNSIEGRGWMYTQPVEEYVDKIVTGDEDAVLCVLLPLLNELRWWVAPMSLPLFAKVITKIAVREREIEADVEAGLEQQQQQQRRCTFPHLAQLGSRNYNGDSFGIDIETLARLSSLPSLRRVCAAGVHQFEPPNWPKDIPLSKVSEVFLVYSWIPASIIQGFAQRFRGPCLMRIHWIRGGLFNRPAVAEDWNRFEIKLEGSHEGSMGKRSEIMDLSDPIEYPRYDIKAFWPAPVEL